MSRSVPVPIPKRYRRAVTFEFRILGPIEVAGERGTVRLGGPRQRAVLAVLVLNRNQVVPVEVVADQLYGAAAPRTAVAQVRDHVSQLRKLLGPLEAARRGSIIETHAPGYLLRADPGQVDAIRFEQHADSGFASLDRGDAVKAAATLREALALWRGPALADFAYDDFAQPAISRLEGLRLRVLERRIEADLLLGRAERLVGELEELVRAHPLREELRAHLMLALYQSGRQAQRRSASITTPARPSAIRSGSILRRHSVSGRGCCYVKRLGPSRTRAHPLPPL